MCRLRRATGEGLALKKPIRDGWKVRKDKMSQRFFNFRGDRKRKLEGIWYWVFFPAGLVEAVLTLSSGAPVRGLAFSQERYLSPPFEVGSVMSASTLQSQSVSWSVAVRVP